MAFYKVKFSFSHPLYGCDIKDDVWTYGFYKESLARSVDERNIEDGIHLSREEAAGEKVYE
jgi:hypothetical protein